MNEKDSAEKILADYEDVFADIVNVLLFDGKELVHPNELETVTAKSQYKADDSRLHEEERDVVKYWKRSGIRIAVCGIEHQTVPDDYMPARVLAYDGASYKSQLLRKDGVIAPVVTLVLYFGTKRWDKAKTLKSLFGNVPKEMEQYVNDYKIHLFEIAWLADEKIEKFQSDFKIVARHFAELRKNPDYMPEGMGTPKHVDELLKLLKAVTGDDRYEKAIALTEEGKTVDQALENLWQFKTRKAIEEAEARGEARGEARVQKLIRAFLAAGHTKEDAADTFQMTMSEVEGYAAEVTA